MEISQKRAPKTSSKKLAIATYRILLSHKKENPTSIQNIVKTLKSKYEIETDRKAVADTVLQIIELLPNNFKYSISEKKNASEYKYSYYSVSRYTQQEMSYIDTIYTNSKIMTEELIRKKYNKSVILPSHLYSKNNKSVSNLDLIKTIASKNVFLSKNYQKIEFNFCFYNYNKELEIIKNADNSPKTYVMIPMEVTFQNGYFYLVSYAENKKNYNYRIDLIDNLKVLDDISNVCNLPKIDNFHYNKNHLYMYSSEPVTVFLKLKTNNRNFTFVYDEFGDNFTVDDPESPIFKVFAPNHAIVIFIRKNIDRVELANKDLPTSKVILTALRDSFKEYL